MDAKPDLSGEEVVTGVDATVPLACELSFPLYCVAKRQKSEAKALRPVSETTVKAFGLPFK